MVPVLYKRMNEGNWEEHEGGSASHEILGKVLGILAGLGAPVA